MDAAHPPSPVVLFALLDWGMGHATRTAPLIQHALDSGWEVHVASKGTALAFLNSQFQESAVRFHTKPGPDIAYARRGTWLKIAAQVPAFLKSIRDEANWTEAVVRECGITHIVSDNCYGVFHSRVPSVLMSHQLQLPVPKGLERLARRFVRTHALQFQAVWIPDDVEARLSGDLATRNPLPHAKFIGVLSRLPQQAATGHWKRVGMVSGPEPHRGLMEKALKQWMQQDDTPSLLIAGRPGAAASVEGNVTIWPDPTAAELAEALKGAETVVCRSGYSSLLDLAALGQRAVLIPTPGQPEQVYLAKHWAAAFGMATCSQRDLERGLLPEVQGTVPILEPNIRACESLTAFVSSS